MSPGKHLWVAWNLLSHVLHWAGVILSFQRSIPKKAERKKFKSPGQKIASFLPNIDQQITVLQAEIRTKQKEEAGESESKFSTGHSGCILNLFYPDITLTYSRKTTGNLPILIFRFLNSYYSCHPLVQGLSCQTPLRTIFSCRNLWTPWKREKLRLPEMSPLWKCTQIAD